MKKNLRRISTHWRALIGLGSVALGTVAVAAAESTVAPGSVVRWPGDEIESCGLGDRRWQPMAGACWYPIDLLTSSGPITLIRWLDGQPQRRAVEVSGYPYEVQYITLQDDSQVNLSQENLQRVRRENARIASLWDVRTPRRFTLPLGAPLDPLPEGRRFGARRYFNNEPRSPHTGTDFTSDSGTPILAVAAGTVSLTGDFFFPGKSVFVDHGDGLISMYFHMSGIAVDEGDSVERGEILGLVGASGRATGPHLHFGVRWHGARIDSGLLLQSPQSLTSLPAE